MLYDHLFVFNDTHTGCLPSKFSFPSDGHCVKTHKIAPAVGNDRGDLEIKDYVVLPRQNQDHPPRTLILDFTIANDLFESSRLFPRAQFSHPRDGTLDPDGALKAAAKSKIRHCRRLYAERQGPIVFMPLNVFTVGSGLLQYSLSLSKQ